MQEVIGGSDVVGYINHYDHITPDGLDFRKREPKVGRMVEGCGIAEYVDFYAKYGNFPGMSACVLKRETVVQVGGFDNSSFAPL